MSIPSVLVLSCVSLFASLPAGATASPASDPPPRVAAAAMTDPPPAEPGYVYVGIVVIEGRRYWHYVDPQTGDEYFVPIP